MARFTQSFGNRVRSLVRQETGLDEIAIDDLATSTKLQSWEAVQIPERLRLFSRLAVTLVLLFFLLIVFVPWTQTITVSGQLSAYTPSERPQDIEAQITGRIKKWHVFEGVPVKQGDLILELDDYDPSFMSPDLLSFLDQRRQALDQSRQAALARAEQLDKRIKEMQNLVKSAVPSAQARVIESENKVREAYQKVEAVNIAFATAELNMDRHKQLAEQGLVSQRELELTIQSALATKADLAGAQASLTGAEQAMKALSFGRDQVSAEVLQRLLDAEAARDASVGEAAKAADQLADAPDMTLAQDRAGGHVLRLGLLDGQLHGAIRHREAEAPIAVDHRCRRRFLHDGERRSGHDVSLLDTIDIGGDRNDAVAVVARQIRKNAAFRHQSCFLG